eukprot:tig00020592_g11638.t1
MRSQLPAAGPDLYTELLIRRRRELLRLVPIQLHLFGEFDKELREAVISLYHHVLPEVSKAFLRDLIFTPNAYTIVLRRSEDDVQRERRERAKNAALVRAELEALEAHRVSKIDPSLVNKETDSEDEETSSYTDSDAEGEGDGKKRAGGGKDGEEEDGDDEEEEEEEEEEETDGFSEDEYRMDKRRREKDAVRPASSSSSKGPQVPPTPPKSAKLQLPIPGAKSDALPPPAVAAAASPSAAAAASLAASFAKSVELAPRRRPHREFGPGDPVPAKARLVGAISYEFVENSLGVRLLQISLIGTRTKYQALGVGARLMDTVKNMRCVGTYDVIITYADHSAVGFFKRHGFTDDAILASRFKGLTDKWDQSVLMCFYPHPEVPSALEESPLVQRDYLDMRSLHTAVEQWRERRLQEYSMELGLIEQMRSEILALRTKAVKQESFIEYLTAELAKERRERAMLEKEFAAYRESSSRQLAARTVAAVAAAASSGIAGPPPVAMPPLFRPPTDGGASSDRDSPFRPPSASPRSVSPSPSRSAGSNPPSFPPSPAGRGAAPGISDVPPGLPKLLQLELAQLASGWEVDPQAPVVRVAPESREFRQVCDEVASSLRPVHGVPAVAITAIFKAGRVEGERQRAQFFERLRGASDAALNLRLFFGAPLDILQASLAAAPAGPRVLLDGFDAPEVGAGSAGAPATVGPIHSASWGGPLNVFGRAGIYFSKYASKAHHYNDSSGAVLLTLVAVGRSETIVTPDPSRAGPSPGYDSIFTPGRRLPAEAAQLPSGSVERVKTPCNEEYVIFHPHQALPMYLIQYEVLAEEHVPKIETPIL